MAVQRKTANLFDKNATDESKGYISQNRYLRSNGNTQTPSGETVWHVSEYIDVHLYDYVTFSGLSGASSSPSMCFYDSNYDYISGVSYNSKTEVTAEVPSTASYIRVSFSENRDYMLNSGSTALPYEPYGWVHSLRKLETSTDTITTLPADIIADGQSATVGLVGNMNQSGTPSPSSIIMPSECGERTGNLFDKSMTVYNAYLTAQGYWSPASDSKSYKIPVEPNTQYTLDAGQALQVFRIGESDNINIEPSSAQTNLLSYAINTRRSTFTTGSNTKCIIFQGSASIYEQWRETLMLNTGSTALPYEPYGYKIPISSGNTTTPVYLGEVESTRIIGKYEFTGNESWSLSGSGYFYSTNSFTNYNHKLVNQITTKWSHYIAGANNSNGQHLLNGYACLYCHATSSIASEVYIRDERYSTATDFKTYLADQYAAGTPVCVWYVLAEPTTGIVNEPIRKIGDYADTVNGVTVPTTGTAEQFDVLTTLKPSEVSLTYTGWHPKSDHKF